MDENERIRRERVVRATYAMSEVMIDHLSNDDGEMELGDIFDVINILANAYLDTATKHRGI